MHPNDEPIFSVSDMARMMGISTQAVRFYHRQGLLIPAYTESNGYRKYSYDQLHRLSAICYLRRMNLSISEIRQYLKLGDPASSLDALNANIEKARQLCAELEQTISTLSERVSFVENAMKEISFTETFIREYPERAFLLLGTETSAATSEAFFRHPTIALYTPGENGHFSIQIGAYLDEQLPSKGENSPTVISIPAGRYLVCYYKGPYGDISDKIRRTKAQYADICFGSEVYCLNIIDSVIENDPEEFVVCAQFPIISGNEK